MTANEDKANAKAVKRDHRYFGWLRYRGSNGAVVELDWRLCGPRRQWEKWRWRFEGETEWRGTHEDKSTALLAAAHACGLSGAEWDPAPRILRSVPDTVDTEPAPASGGGEG